MMQDIAFDISTREIVMKKNDFALTQNPSVQNGGIIEVGKGFTLQNPVLGIGLFRGLQGGKAQQLTVELNRWKAQCYQDGATLANWKGRLVFGEANIKTEINYL